ncbi:uncharacterized protein DSM5745_02751 [Aspergillus mulundensis]|uniref:MYND-type domain-containing protein n=1 Tax=Aspergillus mulundensis TaxID=1810919 RepID=A0A3D8SIF0_9EURO|nr:hypothetical protein DSM5745_02751 [Aspergillus mulundensis]RDW86109.1 hypothetical protein DSM5745_02751 [Aspergillus mulundensis]
MAASRFICANWANAHNSDCSKEGRSACEKCLLVAYCGRSCQTAHWPQHRLDCRSPLNETTWLPDWAQGQRVPSFVGRGVSPGGTKYFWGDVPAIDVVQLDRNEGDGYADELRLLFPASMDLRNIVKTIAQLPARYKKPIEITINNSDIDIVARNVILLLVSVSVQNVSKAVDCIIHLWYSALIRESDLDILRTQIRPLIEPVCKNIEERKFEGFVKQTFNFGQRSFTIVLHSLSWKHVLSCLDVPAGLTAERAREVRRAVTIGGLPRDNQQLFLYCQGPSQRLAHEKFRDDGLLLPFEYPRHEFRFPNPTIFQGHILWRLKPDADPLCSWSSEEVATMHMGPVTADLHGRLFFYLRETLRAFVLRLRNTKVSWKIYQLTTMDLIGKLSPDSFTRIEAANLIGPDYYGVNRTLVIMTDLLQPPTENPHATLVTFFPHAVEDNLTDADNLQNPGPRSDAIRRAVQTYLPFTRLPTSENDPDILRRQIALKVIATWDHVWDRVVIRHQLREAAAFLGVKMKDEHTIVEQWPQQLKLRPGQPGAKEEFERHLADGISNKLRYVEWVRVHPQDVTSHPELDGTRLAAELRRLQEIVRAKRSLT